MNIYISFLLLLFCVHASSQKLHFTQYEISNELLRKNPTCLLRHQNKFLHTGTQNGLYNFDGTKKTKYLRKEGQNQHVTAMYHDGSVLWVGYDDGGIYYQDGDTFSPWIIPDDWPKSKITGLLKDKYGQLWISTYGEGIYIYSDYTLNNIDETDGLGSTDIYCITTDKNGHIFAATDNGIYTCTFNECQKDAKKLVINTTLDTEIIQHISYNPLEKSIYASSYDNGLWQINLHKNTSSKINGINSKINSLTQNNHLLIASDKKLIFVHQQRSTENMIIEGIDADLAIIDTYLDNEGILWVLCKNNGLISTDMSFVKYESDVQQIQAILKLDDKIYLGNDKGLYEVNKTGTSKKILQNENVLTMAHIPLTDEIWVGTFGNGIFIIDHQTGSIKHLNESNGLINNNVFSIIIHSQDVWISTLAGIQQISYYGEFKKSWNKKTGLATDYNYTIFSDSKNNLWVGTDGEGLVYFDNSHKIHKIGDRQTIISIAEDALGKIWFCDLDKGL